MNRPRNRQPRPGQRNKSNVNSRPQANSSRSSPATPQQAASTVPTVDEVVPGASVFIVLKENQPTGKETAGVVAELLTRGNHPRGIKVRLGNGQVGRVQRMGDGALAGASLGSCSLAVNPPSRFSHRYTDVRNDLNYAEEPPARSLADFFPQMCGGAAGNVIDGREDRSTADATVQCPFCDSFQGDEVAVTHHIEREHLH